MTPEQAALIQPGDVVYFPERRDHFVVGSIQRSGIAAPLFWLEVIGAASTALDPMRCSYRIVQMPLPGQPTRSPYRGSETLSPRTMAARGIPSHPSPAYPDAPDNARLYSTAEVAAQLGITPRRVQVLSQARGVGRQVGRAFVFTAADIAAMRDRKSGRPAATTSPA